MQDAWWFFIVPAGLCQHVMNGFEPFSSVGKPLEQWSLFPVERNQFQGSYKCRFMLNIDFHQMNLFFPRYNQAHKTSGTNFQVHPSKIESLKEEMDEAGNKVEQCKVRTGWVSLPHLPWNCPVVQLQIMWLWQCLSWGDFHANWSLDCFSSMRNSIQAVPELGIWHYFQFQSEPGHEWVLRVPGCSRPWSSCAVGGTWRKMKLGPPRSCHSSEQFTFIFISQQQVLHWVLRTETIFISTCPSVL